MWDFIIDNWFVVLPISLFVIGYFATTEKQWAQHELNKKRVSRFHEQYKWINGEWTDTFREEQNRIDKMK